MAKKRSKNCSLRGNNNSNERGYNESQTEYPTTFVGASTHKLKIGNVVQHKLFGLGNVTELFTTEDDKKT